MLKTGLAVCLMSVSLLAQASIFDLFCVQDDAACQPVEQAPASQSKPVSSLQPALRKAASQNQCVDVKGSASLEGVDESFARKMAIRDGLKMASMTNNVSIRTDQSLEQHQLMLDSARFVSNSKVKSYTITDEGLEDPEDMYGQTKEGPLNYEVYMNVCLTEERGLCTALIGNQYQTRLAIAPVVMADAAQAADISNLLPGYQLELERRLRNQGYRNYELMHDVIDLVPGISVTPNLDQAMLEQLRDQTGAQYLLLSAIRSTSSHQNSGFLNTTKRFYNMNVQPDSRYIEADWYLVDLMNQSLVHQSRGGFNVDGDVYVGRDRPFGSNAFFDTDTGMVFHALLENQINDVLDFLHCKPFESQVIDIRNGEYLIHLNADSGAKVGDDLAVYHRTGRRVQFGGRELGFDHVPGAFLKIKRILPKFAIAEVTAKKGVVQVGDVVKTW